MTDYADYDMDAMTDFLDMFEYDSDYESDMERARPRRPPPRTASGRNLARPRPNSNYVTQTQLQAAMAKVGQQIKVNSDAIKTLSGRVDTVQTNLTREVATRKKDVEAVRKDLRQMRELMILLPLLSTPPTTEITTVGGDGQPTKTKVLAPANNSLGVLLPVILMGGLGGGDAPSSGGSSGGLDSSMMLVLALALSGGLGKSS